MKIPATDESIIDWQINDSQINDWQIAEIRKGLAEADRGEFATDEEVASVLNKWSNAAKNRPKS
jgi:predicted transcriptional regulator